MERLGAGGQEIDGLERNIESLVNGIAVNCRDIFSKAAGSATRAAILPEGGVAMTEAEAGAQALMCERLSEVYVSLPLLCTNVILLLPLCGTFS